MDILQGGAVAEMKTGDRVEWPAVWSLGFQQIFSAKSAQQRLVCRNCGGILGLDRIEERFKVGALVCNLSQPALKPRNRRQGDKGLEGGNFGGQFLHHLLDQKVAKGDAFQTLLAVRDRIENG